MNTYRVEFVNDTKPADVITAEYFKAAEGFVEFRVANKPVKAIAAGLIWRITTLTHLSVVK